MLIQSTRRGFLLGATAALVAAPAVVRAGSLMPVRSIDRFVYFITLWGKDEFGVDAIETLPLHDGWAKSNIVWAYKPGVIFSRDVSLRGYSFLEYRGSHAEGHDRWAYSFTSDDRFYGTGRFHDQRLLLPGAAAC